MHLSRPEPWTGLCCSEQHWCSRRALCGTIWGAPVQQRLLTWLSRNRPSLGWMISTQWESEMSLLEIDLNLFGASLLQCTAGPLETKLLWLYLNSSVKRMYCPWGLPCPCQQDCGAQLARGFYLSLANVKSGGHFGG